MALWNKQFRIGRGLYHAIDCSKWEWHGKVLRMNPPHKEIDSLYRQFRKDLKRFEKQKLIVKVGPVYKPDAAREHDAPYPVPMRGKYAYSFTLKDVTYSKWVMKEHKDVFEKLHDWNDLEKLTRLFKSRRILKPSLTAQLVFAAWRFASDKPVAKQPIKKKNTKVK